MQLLSATCEKIAGTTRKLEKTAIVADYLKSRTLDDAATSAVFLSGRVFPAYEETTLQVGGALLWRVVLDVSGKRDADLSAAYRRHGDLGAAAFDVLQSAEPALATLHVAEVAETFRQVAAAHGPSAKAALLRTLLERATPLEAKYLIKIMTGDLRIGLRESLVEEGIAKAYGVPLHDVQQANMLLGDIGGTLRLAAVNRLAEAKMRLFHPIGFMLASPVETAAEAFANFEHAIVEDKYDGIRSQAHANGEDVRFFSRTLDQVTGAFPELLDPMRAFPGEVILDGEIVAWDAAAGRALPFFELQKRLGRKQVTRAMMESVPVAYVVFDVLYADGELVIEKPLRERAAILDRLFAGARERQVIRTTDPQGQLVFEPTVEAKHEPSRVVRAPALRAESAEELEQFFEAALERGNEGLMIKDATSAYTPGRRGRSWLKMKRELATLDVVVTAAEYGHGKRAGVLSDYTFAVRAGEGLANIGKAYSGLTDVEIAELTQWFLNHTLLDHGYVREVEPNIVLEVAFNAIMRSDRHDSGYALRFPRILRIRHDKSPREIDTLEHVQEIYQTQHLPRSA